MSDKQYYQGRECEVICWYKETFTIKFLDSGKTLDLDSRYHRLD
jgi:hypothetical protein